MSTPTLPSPPVPPHLDLRWSPFMPVEVRALRDSREARLGNGEPFRAAMVLRAASWHQMPAGSLPANDGDLMRLAGYKSAAKWAELNGEAMAGFVLCSDARWYHPMVCWMAVCAWNSRVHDEYRRAKLRANVTNQTRRKNGRPLLYIRPPDDMTFAWASDKLPEAMEIEQSYTLHTGDKAARTPKVPPGEAGNRLEVQFSASAANEDVPVRAKKVPKPLPKGPAEKEHEAYEARRDWMAIEVWKAYSDGFVGRYKREPDRRLDTNDQLKLFVQRTGREDAPFVAAYYLTLAVPEYVTKGHPVSTMVRDAEALLAEWLHVKALRTGVKAPASNIDPFKKMELDELFQSGV